MPIDQTLRRVDADLEQGRVLPAINRLRNLVRECPERLDVRLRLAAVYRSQGELAQAGRWSFLDDEVNPRELAAFERQFRTATGRLAALVWTDGTDDLGPQAAERLVALREEAAGEAPGSVRGGEPTRGEKVADTLGCTAVVLVAVLAVIGVGALVVHGARIVIGWL